MFDILDRNHSTTKNYYIYVTLPIHDLAACLKKSCRKCIFVDIEDSNIHVTVVYSAKAVYGVQRSNLVSVNGSPTSLNCFKPTAKLQKLLLPKYLVSG